MDYFKGMNVGDWVRSDKFGYGVVYNPAYRGTLTSGLRSKEMVLLVVNFGRNKDCLQSFTYDGCLIEYDWQAFTDIIPDIHKIKS